MTAQVRSTSASHAQALGCILPSNSPGVHALWLPAIPLKMPLVLKPGREEPWTPYRIAQALIAAGCPAQALSYYPTDHGGSTEILLRCNRSLLFGGGPTVAPWRDDPRVQLHGPGRSKIIIGADKIDHWEHYLDLMAASIASNGGRSCLNASGVWVPAHGRAIAAALGERLSQIQARPLDDPQAQIAAFSNPAVAHQFSSLIDGQLGDAADTARGQGERVAETGGCTFLNPTLIHAPRLATPTRQYRIPLPLRLSRRSPTRRNGHAHRPNAGSHRPHRGRGPNAPTTRRAPHRTPQPRPDPHPSNRLGSAARGQPLRLPLPATRLAAQSRMTPFDFDPSIRVVFGAETLDQLGDLASALAGPRALLVTDPGLVQAGLAEQAQYALQNADLATTTFSAVGENPTTEHVAAGVHHARAHGPIDLIVALGGGSAMDCAKGINFLLTNGGQNARTTKATAKPPNPCCPPSASPPLPERAARPNPTP